MVKAVEMDHGCSVFPDSLSSSLSCTVPCALAACASARERGGACVGCPEVVAAPAGQPDAAAGDREGGPAAREGRCGAGHPKRRKAIA
eukprot:4580793-Pyramimonas_sp.AAC.1